MHQSVIKSLTGKIPNKAQHFAACGCRTRYARRWGGVMCKRNEAPMKYRATLLLVVVLLIPTIGSANDLGACQKIFALSQSALSNKAKGVSKEKLVSALPPKQSGNEPEPLRSMREIVGEVYSYQIINQFAYSVYRTELCVLREAGQAPSVEFEKILSELNSCSVEDPECAMQLAGSKL